MNKLLFFSGSRSESSLLIPIIKSSSKKAKCGIVIGGSHTSKIFGNTFKEFRDIKNTRKYFIKHNFKSLSKHEINLYSSKILLNLQKIIAKFKPDAIILLGDRWESMMVSVCALHNEIPTVHIHGGEKTSGSMDDIYRHCISKMSLLHFVSHKDYKKRLIQLGEDKKNIYISGSIGAENVKKHNFQTKKSIEKKFKIKFNLRNILISIHPEINFKVTNLGVLERFISTISKDKNNNIFITMPSIDSNSIEMHRSLKNLTKIKNIFYIKSFGKDYYLSFLKHCDFIIGNSSSAIYEAPSLKTFAINIGDRQAGRLQSGGVFNVPYNFGKIIKIFKKLSKINNQKFFYKFKNIFYKKNTSENITNKICSYNFKKTKNKIFIDIKFNDKN
tara:strand:- start:10057 stop:11217 length:1161 start_codon:yes stop_codon:yes gene_type:complete